jgi:hypothetical protein
MKSIIISLSLIGSLCAWAQPRPTAVKDAESIYFNLGSHTEFFNFVQTNSSGEVRKFELAPTIGAGMVLPWLPDWSFNPEINWVLPRTAGDNQRIIKNLWMLRADLAYQWQWLKLRAGTSVMWLNMHGRGGEVVVNNGNDTSTFYYPHENRSSLNNTFDLGAEMKWDDWSLRLQTYTYSLFQAEARQLSYSLFLTHYWKQ